jgi:hypothetical protein
VKAAIEGDVYLVTEAGDTKRGAGRTILLLRDAGGLLDTLVARCARLKNRQAPLVLWRAKLQSDTEKIAREERPGGPSIYDVVSREQRIDKGLVALDRERRDTAVAILARALVDSTSRHRCAPSSRRSEEGKLRRLQ